MPTLKFETDEIAAYGDLLVRASGVAVGEARKVLQKGLLNIKTDARRRRERSRYFPALARAITYESHETLTGGWGEVGPEHGKRQGNMGHIPEYGALKTPPEPYMRPAAEAELPRFERAVADLVEKALGR